MLKEWKRQRAIERVRAGDGRSLQRFRWWQLPGRALFYLQLDAEYAVDVLHWQNQSSGEVKADLYRDGTHVAVSKLPAAFPLAGGVVEVAMSGNGIKRCHFVADDGTENQLRPDRASAEGRRARLEQNHPLASRSIGLASVVMLLVGVASVALHVAENVSRIPPIADSVGIFVSPIDLPVWLTIALGVGAVLGAIERSLRLRHHWLLDAVGT